MKEAIIIDFEDSFVYNIYSELLELDYKVTVYESRFLKEVLKDKSLKKKVLVLGPGPGHPDKFKSFYPIIEKLIFSQQRILGICLGHQVLLRSLGFKITTSSNILHGFSQKIELNNIWQEIFKLNKSFIEVQRYNSLEIIDNEIQLDIQKLLVGDRVYAFKFLNSVSYQFHPESIGSKDHKSFFSPIR